MEELIQCGVRNLIRIGSCGALQPECALGDLILVTGAIRDDGTSTAYVEAQYPAIPDFELLSACRESAADKKIPYHMGICRSHSCLYGDRNPELYSYWTQKHAVASDMETAALFVLGSLRGPHRFYFECSSCVSVFGCGRYRKICGQRGNIHERGRKRNSYRTGGFCKNSGMIRRKTSREDVL